MQNVFKIMPTPTPKLRNCMSVQLQRGLPAYVTASMALQHLRELHYESAGRQYGVSTFSQKSASAMDQLLSFASVVQWLLEKLGGTLGTYSEFDEPNSIALEILQACRPFVALDGVAPHELRSGSGDTVCQLLLALTQAVLQKQPSQKGAWNNSNASPYQTNKHGLEHDDDNDDEHNLGDDLADGMEDAIMGVGGSVNGLGTGVVSQAQIAPGVADVHLWQEECSAMEPQLGAAKFSFQSDWRPDIAKLSNLNAGLAKSTNLISQQLQIVADQLGKQIERLQQREQFLNQQISQFSGKLIEESRKHATLQKEAEDITKDIESLNQQLQDITEKNKVAKNEMTYETGRINDSSAVTYTKQAIAQLSAEIRDIDLKIVLAQQRLFQFEQK